MTSAADKRTLIEGTYLQMIELAHAGNEILRKSEKKPAADAAETAITAP
jgi:hypothetical protein